MEAGAKNWGDLTKAVLTTVLLHVLVVGWFWYESTRDVSKKNPAVPTAYRTILLKLDSDGPKLQFSPAGGVFRKPVSVTISPIGEPGTIHYTTDNNDPTDKSPKYTGPIKLTKTAVLTVLAFDKLGNKSVVYRMRYVLDQKRPPLALSVSPAEPIGPVDDYTLTFTAPASGMYMLRLGGDDSTTGELLLSGRVTRGKRGVLKINGTRLLAEQQDVTLYILKPGKNKKGQQETITFSTVLLAVDRGEQGTFPYPMSGTYKQPVKVRFIRSSRTRISFALDGQLPSKPTLDAPSVVTVRHSGLLTLRIAKRKTKKDELRPYRYLVDPRAPMVRVPAASRTPQIVGKKAKTAVVIWTADVDGKYTVYLGEGTDPDEKPLATGYVMARTPMHTKIDVNALVSGLNAVTIRVEPAPLPPWLPLNMEQKELELPKILEATIIPRLGLAKPDKKKVPVLQTYQEPERLPEAINLKKKVTPPKKKPLRHFDYKKPKLAKKRRTLSSLLKDLPLNKDKRRRYTPLDKIVGKIDGSPWSNSPMGKKGNQYAGRVTMRIQRVMSHPPSISNQALRRLRVEIMISQVDSDGNVLRFEMHRSSGNRAFDSSARRTIKKFMSTEGGTKKLPKPPAKILNYINTQGLLVIIDGRFMRR